MRRIFHPKVGGVEVIGVMIGGYIDASCNGCMEGLRGIGHIKFASYIEANN